VKEISCYHSLSAAISSNSHFFQRKGLHSLFTEVRVKPEEKYLFSLVITQDLYKTEYLLTSSLSQIYKHKAFHTESKQTFWKEQRRKDCFYLCDEHGHSFPESLFL